MKAITIIALLFALFAAGCKPEQPDPQTYLLDEEVKRYFYNPFKPGNYWIFYCEENNDYDTVTVPLRVHDIEVLGQIMGLPANWGPNNGDYNYHEQVRFNIHFSGKSGYFDSSSEDFLLCAYKDYIQVKHSWKVPRAKGITTIFSPYESFQFIDTTLFGKSYQNCFCYGSNFETCIAPDLGVFKYSRKNDILLFNYKLINYYIE